MIDRIIEFCYRNKFIVFLLTAGAVVGAFFAIRNISLDAIPDLSETQVIIFSRWDRSPDIIEDQVTYPIVSSLLGAPKVKAVRGYSDFGFSYVYVIFEDGTDIYWARSRVLEYLSKITPNLPDGVATELGPDATSLGWVFQYALVDTSGRHNLAELRSIQDWFVRYRLESVQGVAEVATVGGFVRQYQVTVDPNALSSYRIPLTAVIEAIRKSNSEVGGRVVEFSGAEYMVRARGYIKSTQDIENITVGTDSTGTPILLRNLGKVSIGPDMRRGVADLDGKGDAVGGVVVMRYNENALNVIKNVKTRLREIQPSLPQGVQIITTYDRSDLINRSIDTLTSSLIQEMIIVALVIILFLWHLRSAAVPIFLLPVSVALSFIPMYFMKITSNIMSLGGIAIAIGAMVDASIVLTENAHKHLETWDRGGRKEPRDAILLPAMKEVGRPIFFSLLVIAISFLPIFTLEAQEGRLFQPLAFTKTFAMAFAAVLAVTLAPALVSIFLKGKFRPEEKHPVSRFLFKLYKPVVNFVIRYKYAVVITAAGLIVASIPLYFMLGSEFMPPLNEGSILYMPTTMPGLSVTEAADLLQRQDKVLSSFPEVERVFGKAGRAETATDPAPFSMMETVVLLKPESQWGYAPRWYSNRAPEFLKVILRLIWPERKTWDGLLDEMDRKMQFAGVSNAWTMPIKARIDMLSTGIRTPVGIKVSGPDLDTIQMIGEHIETALRDVKGTRSVYSERVAGGYYVDFDIDRPAIARYGLTVDDVQMVIMSAVGGENVSTTIEGRERYPVNVRYPRELRDNLEKLGRVLVATPSGAQIPLAQLADIHLAFGPSMIRDENGLLTGYVYVDLKDRDIGRYVKDAKQTIGDQISLPHGYSLSWSGQYEYMERVKQRLLWIVPLTFFLVFLLLYFNTRSVIKTLIVLLAVPFSLIGAFAILYALGYNMSIAVWVGIIALAGVDAETGVVMLLYLDLAYKRMKDEGRMRTADDLKSAVIEGAVKRIRPKMMTVGTTFMGLLPIMWAASSQAGADVMKRIAAPMIGGIFTSFIMELLVYPAIFFIWKWHSGIGKKDLVKVKAMKLKRKA